MTYAINPYRFAKPVIPADRWRVVTLGGDRVGCSLGEVELATSIGGANIATGGTPNILNGGGGGINLFDGSATTFNGAAAQAADRWAIEYLLSAPALVAQFRVRARDTVSGWLEAPKAFFTQTSQDGGATWLSIDLFSNTADWVSGETRSVAVGDFTLSTGRGRGNARGWRCRITGINGAVPPMVGELAFAASSGGPNICTGGAAFASSASNFVGREARAAFDGNAATRWNGSGAGPTGEWRLGYARQVPLGEAVEARITINSNGAEIAQAPISGFFDWSEDWWTWTQAGSFSIPSPVAGTTYSFAI
jgi:hypothetical protein